MSKSENYDMEKLYKIRRIARKLGLKGEVAISNKPEKKYRYYKEDGDVVYFGNSNILDYLDTKDAIKRNLMRQKLEKLKTTRGKRKIDILESSTYLSYNILWGI